MASFRRRGRRRRFRRRRRRGGRANKIQLLDLGHIHNNSFVPTIASTGYGLQLTDVDVGSSAAQRTGNRLIAHSFLLRGELAIHASASHTVVKMLIVYVRKDLNGIALTGPNLAEIYDSYSGKPWAMRNLDNLREYQIVWSKTYKLSTEYPSRFVVIPVKFRPRMSKYDGTNGATNQTSGQYYFFAWSDEATNTPTLTAQYRFRYHR